MEITPKKDFLYSLDGYTTTAFVKGVVVSIPDVHGKILEKAGYLESSITESITENTTSEVVEEYKEEVKEVSLLTEIKGMKTAFIPKLKVIGVETIEDLKTKTVDELKAVDGISEKVAKLILNDLN